LKIDIRKPRQCRDEDAYLVIEFFRRMALLDRVLNSGSSSPFFDVAGLIDPKTGAEDHSLPPGDQFSTLSLPAQRVCVWHIHFLMLPTDALAGLPMQCSPYEPLIELLNSGGRFRLEDVFVDIGQLSIPWTKWRSLADSE
jgi:hypothetical protein